MEFSVPVPSVVEPFLKVTDSPPAVRFTTVDGLKVAVSTTDCPGVLPDAGLAPSARVVVTGDAVNATVLDVLAASLVSPS